MTQPLTPQSDVTFEELSQRIRKYLEARDWHNNTPRSLATSMVLEASELLEHYQWSDKPVGDKEDLGEELADILVYAFQFAHQNNIDIPAAIEDKLQKVEKKYPAEMFKDANGRDRDSAWYEAKKNHKKKGL